MKLFSALLLLALQPVFIQGQTTSPGAAATSDADALFQAQSIGRPILNPCLGSSMRQQRTWGTTSPISPRCWVIFGFTCRVGRSTP